MPIIPVYTGMNNCYLHQRQVHSWRKAHSPIYQNSTSYFRGSKAHLKHPYRFTPAVPLIAIFFPCWKSSLTYFQSLTRAKGYTHRASCTIKAHTFKKPHSLSARKQIHPKLVHVCICMLGEVTKTTISPSKKCSRCSRGEGDGDRNAGFCFCDSALFIRHIQAKASFSPEWNLFLQFCQNFYIWQWPAGCLGSHVSVVLANA